MAYFTCVRIEHKRVTFPLFIIISKAWHAHFTAVFVFVYFRGFYIIEEEETV